MIFGQDRNELRQMYKDAWSKHLAGQVLSPLESQIAAVIEWHPEYHGTITDGDLSTDFLPDGGQTNPFLHMGLHLGIREQVATNRPNGIRDVFDGLVASGSDQHSVEHRMIDCLAETLWEAQSSNSPPDENKYLHRLRQLASKSL